MHARTWLVSFALSALFAGALAPLTGRVDPGSGGGIAFAAQGLTKCPKCKKKVEPKWKFCDKCGTKLTPPSPPKPPPPTANSFAPNVNTGHSQVPKIMPAVAKLAAKQLTSGADVVRGIAISSDGGFVVYGSNRGQTTDIYMQKIIWSETGAKMAGPDVQITDSKLAEFDPDISPDGSMIVFCAEGTDNASSLIAMTLADKQVQWTVSLKGIIWQPRWSPDGSTIAFVFKDHERAPGEIMTVDRFGEHLTNLTENMSDDLSPSWCPKGCHLAYESNRNGPYQVWSMDLAAKSSRQLSSEVAMARKPVWGKDRIIFESNVGATIQLFAMNENGVHTRRVTENTTNNRRPRLSADGTKLAFVQAIGDSEEVFVALSADKL